MVRYTDRPESMTKAPLWHRHRLAVSIGAGIGFGFVGTVAFLALTSLLGNWYVVLSLLPAFAAGFGVKIGIRQKNSRGGAVIGGIMGLVWMLATYLPIYTFVPSAADPIGDGILIVSGMGMGAVIGWNPEELPEFLQ